VAAQKPTVEAGGANKPVEARLGWMYHRSLLRPSRPDVFISQAIVRVHHASRGYTKPIMRRAWSSERPTSLGMSP